MPNAIPRGAPDFFSVHSGVYRFAAPYEAVAADAPSRETWEIEDAMPGVCKVTLIHDGLAAGSATSAQVTGGWLLIMSGLKTLLETGKTLAGG